MVAGLTIRRVGACQVCFTWDARWSKINKLRQKGDHDMDKNRGVLKEAALK